MKSSTPESQKHERALFRDQDSNVKCKIEIATPHEGCYSKDPCSRFLGVGTQVKARSILLDLSSRRVCEAEKKEKRKKCPSVSPPDVDPESTPRCVDTHSQTVPCHSCDRAFRPGRASRASALPRPASRQSRPSRRALRAIHERCARACRGRQTARETVTRVRISLCVKAPRAASPREKRKEGRKTYVCQLQRTCAELA